MADKFQAEKAYIRLFEKVSELYRTSGESQLSAHWETGRYLEEIKQAFPEKAVHGENFIDRLAADLTKKYGKGFSPSSLKNMRIFYREYPKRHPGVFLDWTKIVLLLRVEDRTAREELIRKTLDESLTRKQLQDLIHAYRLSLKNGKGLVEEELSFGRGELYRYRPAPVQDSSESRELTVDCGFNVWRTVAFLNSEKPGEGVFFTVDKRHSGYFIAEVLKNTAAERKKSYTYPARVERVIDGDTLWLQVDIGFGTMVRQKIRLRGVDTPEMEFDEGRKAKGFVQRQLKECPFVIIKTFKTDKYDRYIADLFYLKGEENLEIICQEGSLLNNEIIRKGYGSRV